MFFADPKLDSRYNLYLEFYKTQFFADPNLDSHYNLYLEFDNTMFFADPNLDSRYILYLYLIKLGSLLTPTWTPVTTCIYIW